jgi:hypothetical protein
VSIQGTSVGLDVHVLSVAAHAVDEKQARRPGHGGVRHRLSKLLLRQGRIYSGGTAWAGPREQWLRRGPAPQPDSMTFGRRVVTNRLRCVNGHGTRCVDGQPDDRRRLYLFCH